METTITILSIIIIVLCGALAYLHVFWYGQIKPELDKRNEECRNVGNYSGKDTYGGYHSESEWKDIRHREQLSDQFKKMIELEREIAELKKEKIEALPKNGISKVCQHSVGIYPELVSVPCNHRIVPVYRNVIKDEETKEIKSFTIDMVSICADGDVLTEEAKESIKKQFSEKFAVDKNFKIVDHKPELDLSLEPTEDRLFNQAKKPVPPKPRNN